MYIYTKDDDSWMRAERAARERIQDVNDKIQKARIEVAMEVFEEIEKLLEFSFSSCHISGTEEQFDFYRADLGFQIAELKNKYTEKKWWTEIDI